ncbi:MAG TPA: putative quinol monooxygenase [Chroococcales cyanobacterium]
MSKVTVVATAVAKPGKEKELERILTGLIEPTRKEEGFIQYDLHRSLDDPRVFIFFEIWESRAHLDKHAQNDHLVKYREEAKDLIERKELHILEQIG